MCLYICEKVLKWEGGFLPWEFALFIDQRSFKQSTRTDVASYKSFRDPDLVFIVTLIAFFTLFYPIYSTNILLRRGSHGKFLSRGPSNKNKEIPCLSFVQVVSWRHTRTNCCMNHCHHHQFYSFIFVFLQQHTSQSFNSFFWFLTCILLCMCLRVYFDNDDDLLCVSLFCFDKAKIACSEPIYLMT